MGIDVTQMISIRGNIRQQLLPFVLKPSSDINSNVNEFNLKDGPQYFSFRNKEADKYKAGFGRLNICPSVLNSPEFGLYFNKDISNQLLYDYNSKDKITIDSFLNQLPGVQVREFQVDSKLDQFVNLFFDLFQSAASIFKEAGMKISDVLGVGSDASRDKFFSKMKEMLSACWDYCIAQGKFKDGPNLLQNADGSSRWSVAKLNLSKADKALTGFNRNNQLISQDLTTYIMNFPFLLYYRLYSCTTLNVYELPYVGDQLWSTEGKDGWENEAMQLSKGSGKDNDSMLGKVLSMVGPGFGDLMRRIKIDHMPRWDAHINGKLGQITLSFDLFNDTKDAALKNFIFINTIIPNNLWMQYGMLRHSPCLYDVKIEGLKRLFLCTANFNVKSSGIMRTPSIEWIHELCLKHANLNSWKATELINDIINHNLIKIPDVYTVEMTFTSLIPDNFNTFLYNYSKNSQMELYTNEDAYQPTVLDNIIKPIQADLAKETKSIADSAIKEITDIRAKEKAAEAEKNKKK